MTEWITHQVSGDSLVEAFNADVEEARDQHGRSGQSGTLAEFNHVVLVTDEVLTLDEANTFADRVRDSRVTDSTAGAVAIIGDKNRHDVSLLEVPIGASTFEVMTAAAAVSSLMPCERPVNFVCLSDTEIDGVRRVSGNLHTEIDMPVAYRKVMVSVADSDRASKSHEDTVALIEQECDLQPGEKLSRVIHKGRENGAAKLTWRKPAGEPVIRYVISAPNLGHRDFNTGFDTLQEAIDLLESLTPEELAKCGAATRITGVVGIPGADRQHEQHITMGGGHYLATLTREYPDSVSNWEATVRCGPLPDWVKPTGWLVFGWADS